MSRQEWRRVALLLRQLEPGLADRQELVAILDAALALIDAAR